MSTGIDPFDRQNHNKPLWVLFGSEAWPQVLCARIHGYGPSIWGYSVYRRSPGFRTLGRDLRAWISEQERALFFDDHDAMLAELKKWTTPHPKAIAK